MKISAVFIAIKLATLEELFIVLRKWKISRTIVFHLWPCDYMTHVIMVQYLFLRWCRWELANSTISFVLSLQSFAQTFSAKVSKVRCIGSSKMNVCSSVASFNLLVAFLRLMQLCTLREYLWSRKSSPIACAELACYHFSLKWCSAKDRLSSTFVHTGQLWNWRVISVFQMNLTENISEITWAGSWENAVICYVRLSKFKMKKHLFKSSDGNFFENWYPLNQI